MERLIIWGATILVSLGMEIALVTRKFKDIGNEGYKLNKEKASDLKDQLDLNKVRIKILSSLIPMYNVVKVLQEAMEYSNSRDINIDKLRTMDLLIPMTDEEQETYNSRPSGLYSLAISFGVPINKKEETKTINYTDGDKISSISDSIDEDVKMITNETEGPVANLSEEQREEPVVSEEFMQSPIFDNSEPIDVEKESENSIVYEKKIK